MTRTPKDEGLAARILFELSRIRAQVAIRAASMPPDAVAEIREAADNIGDMTRQISEAARRIVG